MVASLPAAKVEEVTQGVEAPKSIEQITSESAAKFPPSEGATPAEPLAQVRQRKPRSDIGQPRRSKGLGKSAAQNAALASAEAGQAAAYTIDKQIVEKTASTVLHTFDSVLTRKVGSTVIKLGGDLELATEMAKDSGLTQGECQLMSELTGVIFEKHGLLTGYAPEILLSVLLAEWGIRVSLTMRKLNAMVETQEKKKQNDSTRSDWSWYWVFGLVVFLHHRPIKTVITGKSGSGKTTYFERLLANGFKSYWPTIFLYDWQGEMSERLNLQPTVKIDQLPQALKTGFVCFDPSIEYEGDYETGLLFFADWSFQVCKSHDTDPPYPRLFACDEIQLLTEPGKVEPEIQRILQTGRRCGLDMAIVSQQLNELHNKLRSQSTEQVCFQHNDPRVLQVLGDWGFSENEISSLTVGEYYYQNDRGERTRQTMFSPKNIVDNSPENGEIESS